MIAKVGLRKRYPVHRKNMQLKRYNVDMKILNGFTSKVASLSVCVQCSLLFNCWLPCSSDEGQVNIISLIGLAEYAYSKSLDWLFLGFPMSVT